MNYEDMLKKATEEMPSSVHERQRFEVPKVKGHLEGSKTIISNLDQISTSLARPPEHLFKFLLKELATPGTVRKGKAILGAKVSASKINDKIEKYTHDFVLCKECGKPETQFVKENNLTYVQCQACGAKYVVKTKI